MIKQFVNSWEKHKDTLREYFKTHTMGEYNSYKDLVVLLFTIINLDASSEYNKFDIEHLTEIDDGEYQGTLIYLIPQSSYQPCAEEYVWTAVDYGSCSGCDILLSILGCDNEIPNEQQIDDLMYLVLHLLQRCKYLVPKGEEGEPNE